MPPVFLVKLVHIPATPGQLDNSSTL